MAAHVWQTWKTKNEREIPEKLMACLQKWRELGYAHTLLDDDDLKRIVAEVVPEHAKDYDNFTHTIERVDFARYAILFKHGGVYADLDMLPLKRVDKFIECGEIVLGYEPPEHAKNYDRTRLVCNAIMFSPPGKRFWKELMDYIIQNYEHRYDPVKTTGPLALTRFIESSGHKVRIEDHCVFYPLTSSGISPDCDLKKSYTVHLWENSWVKPPHKNPMWFNTRYWSYFLTFAFFMLWVWCWLR